MADAPLSIPCDHCDGRGWWSGGCDREADCFQCHGTGVQRAQGNCDWCLGWGWTVMAGPCVRCAASGWVDADVALYRCAACERTIEAPTTEPRCPHGDDHALTRLTATTRG